MRRKLKAHSLTILMAHLNTVALATGMLLNVISAKFAPASRARSIKPSRGSPRELEPPAPLRRKMKSVMMILSHQSEGLSKVSLRMGITIGRPRDLNVAYVSAAGKSNQPRILSRLKNAKGFFSAKVLHQPRTSWLVQVFSSIESMSERTPCVLIACTAVQLGSLLGMLLGCRKKPTDGILKYSPAIRPMLVSVNPYASMCAGVLLACMSCRCFITTVELLKNSASDCESIIICINSPFCFVAHWPRTLLTRFSVSPPLSR
mmetsp:Transcript_64609/g.202334  ORF Transcript_64609/g.202334 Transcript_64609/m.202334 type:complete len:261 (-) Transcript_64609:381-1163(-)